jgi:hypothetical protein
MSTTALSTIKRTILIVFGLVIVLYSGFQAQKIIVGPVIDIYTPENGATYNMALIEITGRAKNVSFINLNDRKIFTDTAGYFKEKLLLSPGYNILKLDARDKFGSYTEKRLELILKEY